MRARAIQSGNRGEPGALIDLAVFPVGATGRVIRIDPAEQDMLTPHGLRPGSLVRVDVRGPFGGPCLVRVGRTRLGVAQCVCRHVWVTPLGPDLGPSIATTEP